MPISLTCPKCSGKLRVADNLAGKKIKCPKCSAVLPVAAAEEDAITAETPPPAEPEGIAAAFPAHQEIAEEQLARPRGAARNIRRDPTTEAVSTIIPYKNGRALAAYYLGVFSLIPCLGLLLGPAALVLGILGLRFVKANPTAKGTGHALAGIILGGLTTLGNWGVVIVAIVLGGISAFAGTSSQTTVTGPVAIAPNNPGQASRLFTLGHPLFAADCDLFNPNHRINPPPQPGRVAALLAGFEIHDLAFSADGKILAVATDRNLQLWEVATGELRTIAVVAFKLVFSDDGRHLAVGRYTKQGLALEIYDSQTGAVQQKLLEGTMQEIPSGMAFSPSGELFAATAGTTFNVWETATWRKQPHDFKKNADGNLIDTLTFDSRSPATLVVTMNSRILIWDAKAMKEKASIREPWLGGQGIALTPDGKILVTGTYVGDLYLWDIEKHREIRHLGKHEGSIHSLKFLEQGKVLAAASMNDATLKLWDMFRGRELTSRQVCPPGKRLTAFARSPDGRTLLTGGDEGLIRVWDVASLLGRKPG
jgi:hypothetical protein